MPLACGWPGETWLIVQYLENGEVVVIPTRMPSTQDLVPIVLSHCISLQKQGEGPCPGVLSHSSASDASKELASLKKLVQGLLSLPLPI